MNKQIQFMDRVDEQGRFMGLESFLVPKMEEIYVSHGISYLEGRSLRESIGYTMGLNSDLMFYKLIEND